MVYLTLELVSAFVASIARTILSRRYLGYHPALESYFALHDSHLHSMGSFSNSIRLLLRWERLLALRQFSDIPRFMNSTRNSNFVFGKLFPGA